MSGPLTDLTIPLTKLTISCFNTFIFVLLHGIFVSYLGRRCSRSSRIPSMYHYHYRTVQFGKLQLICEKGRKSVEYVFLFRGLQDQKEIKETQDLQVTHLR